MNGLGYSRTVPVTLVHTLYGRSWIFQDCPSYFGTRDTQTQACIHCMDGLGYSRTVPVTLVHGILRNRGAYNTLLRMDGLGYSRTVPVTLLHGILRHRGALTMCGLSWILQT